MRLPDKIDLHPKERPDSQPMNKDQRLRARAATAVPERRKSSRTAIHRPAYINFAPYNHGGVITDISETGLRFHTVDALEQGGIVRVSILLGSANQIEAVGELIWKDATRRVGGLRFTVLPAGAADQIRNWAESPNGANLPGGHVSEAGASPRTATSQARQEAPIVNPALPRSEAVSVTENQVSESKSEPKSPELPQPKASETPAPSTSTRSPWVPPSMRPPSSAPSIQPPSQDSPGAGTPSPARPWPPAAYPQPGSMPPAAPMPWITHFDPDPPAGRWVFVRGVLGGVIICLLLAGAGWFAAGHYAGNDGAFPFSNPFASHPVVSNPVAPRPYLPSGDLPDVKNDVNPANSLPSDQSEPAPSQQSSSSAKPSAQPDTQSNLYPRPIPNPESRPAPDSTAAPAPQSKDAQAATLPQSTVAQAPAAAAPSSDILSAAKGTSPAALQPIAKAPAPQPASDAGESQLTLARQYLDGRSRPRNPAAASQLLWSAVEKGNSLAEMDLADLYLRGDGVARNCDQARVLLSAASGKGNAEAMQKLSELNRTGCR
jgi:PilZ domain-containing protein